MSTDLRADVTAAYADVTLGDPLEQVVRRGRRIRRARRARRAAPALVAAAAVVVGVAVVQPDDGRPGAPGPIELVDYSVPAFPLSFDPLPAGLEGPDASLDPSFDEVGPGVAFAGWSDPADPGSGIGITVGAELSTDGEEEIGETEIGGEDATVYQAEVTGRADQVSVVWERADDQWVRVTGTGRFGSEERVVDLARRVTDRGFAVPLQVSFAPRGWVVVAYKMDRVLTLADPAGRPATEALARTLTVHVPTEPSAPADLPRDVGATDGRMDQVTVQGQPAYLLPTAEVWFLQATLPDGTVFTLQAPLDFTPEQVVEVADGVGRS